MEAISIHRRILRRIVFGLLTLTALAIVPPAAAQALAPRSGVTLDTEQPPPLTAADRDFVVKVRLAGLWEQPAGAMAQQKGASPRVRQIGKMISEQHVQLDALDRAAARKLDIPLPNRPTSEQQRWLDEMAGAEGSTFDDIFVMRLRAAHGKIFPAIGLIRATTQNPMVRTLAQQASGFVLNHLSYLESTGLVQYQELPPAAKPATGPLVAKASGNPLGAVSMPLVWMVLGVALVAGAVATGRVLRPEGGRNRAPRPAGRSNHDRVDAYRVDAYRADAYRAGGYSAAYRADAYRSNRGDGSYPVNSGRAQPVPADPRLADTHRMLAYDAPGRRRPDRPHPAPTAHLTRS